VVTGAFFAAVVGLSAVFFTAGAFWGAALDVFFDVFLAVVGAGARVADLVAARFVGDVLTVLVAAVLVAGVFFAAVFLAGAAFVAAALFFTAGAFVAGAFFTGAAFLADAFFADAFLAGGAAAVFPVSFVLAEARPETAVRVTRFAAATVESASLRAVLRAMCSRPPQKP
jgi:hypothetical protein